MSRIIITMSDNSALGHSVPMIDGVSQQAGAAYKANVRHADMTADDDRFVVELQDAYAIPGLQKLERSWTWRKNGSLPRLELEDHYVFSERAGAALTERFICQVQPVVAGAGRVELVGAAFKLVLSYDEALMEPVVEPLAFLNHFGQEKLYYALDMRVRVTDDLERRLRFEFYFEGLE